MSAEDHDYRRRMDNWRRWRISERRSLGGSPYPVYNLSPRPPRGENIMPLLVGEAEETDQAVQALSAEVRRAVEVWYLREGSINQKRKMLGCRRERMLALLEDARAAIKAVLRGEPVVSGGRCPADDHHHDHDDDRDGQHVEDDGNGGRHADDRSSRG